MSIKKLKKPIEEQPAESEEAPIDKEIRVIAQEVKIVQALACNDLNKRNRQLRKLTKWLELRSRSSFPFTEDDFQRIWKGLYYTMWLSDKPLVQEDLAEQLGKLVNCFDGNVEYSVHFFGAFLHTMCQQWFGIDQWRIDKFLLLTRRMLRYMFRTLKIAGWSKECVECFNEHMRLTVLAEKSSATGLTMHFLDIFCEELAKVSDGKISAEHVGDFVRPFVAFIATQRDFKLVSHCRKRVFYHLLYQSALGREYTEKYNAWKEMGFPTSSIHDLEKDDTPLTDEEEEDTEEQAAEPVNQKHLDPRAGNVDVIMPELPFDAKYIIEELETFIYKRESNTKCRKMLKKLLELLQTYQKGVFPLGVKRMPRYESKAEKPLINDKIQQLENMENEMFSTGRKLKQLNKRKRRKLLKSLNFENLDESNFEQAIEKALPKQYLQERKKARESMMSGWVEEEIENVDLTPQKKKKTKPVGAKQTHAVNKQKHKKVNASEDEPAKKMKKSENVANPHDEKKDKTKTPEITKEQPAEANADKLQKTAKSPVTTTIKDTPTSEWDTPVGEGEIEYFIPSRKIQMKKANSDLVLNPLAKQFAGSSTPKKSKQLSTSAANTPTTPASVKRVKIALKNNTTQNPSEYINQIKSSPNLPFDADRKPGKGLLKPNSMPSPINPFYKKKIGLRLANDTI